MARRGRRPLADETKKRGHVISVRVSKDELSRLDVSRGNTTRASYLYSIWQGFAPAQIPGINVLAWGRLGKMLGGVTYLLQREGLTEEDRTLLADLKKKVIELREELIGRKQK